MAKSEAKKTPPAPDEKPTPEAVTPTPEIDKSDPSIAATVWPPVPPAPDKAEHVASAPDREETPDDPASHDIAAMIKPIVTKTVVEILNSINLPDQITKVTGDAVDARLKPIMDQLKALLPSVGSGNSAGGLQSAPDGTESPPAQNNSGQGNFLETLLMAFMQNKMGGNNNNGGMDQMTGFFNALTAFQNVSNTLTTQPLLNALNMYKTVFTVGASMGKSTDDLAKSADVLAENIRNAAKAQPAK